MKRVISEEDVERELEAGRRRISAPRATTVITPGAWSKARALGVTFDRGSGEARAKPAGPTAGLEEPGRAERVVDASGVMVVRGRSVQLGRFTGAGPDRNVRLLDLVTGADGSPMCAGIMSWRREDSFPWHLDYDEVDLVLEGVLQIEIDGRTIEGRPGDVLYIPKGSQIVFGTPSRTRVFYVTYPATWAGTAPLDRPQK